MQTVQQIQQIIVQRLHGTLMGPVVESQEYDQRDGKLYRVFQWEVANGTYVEKDLPHGWRAEVSPTNFNKSKLVLRISRKRDTSDAYLDGFFTDQTKEIGQVDLTPNKFKRFVRTKETTNRLDLPMANVSEIPDVPTLTGNQTKITHDKVDDNNYDQSVFEEILDVSATPLLGQLTDTWGVNGMSERLVNDANPALTPFGFGIKQASTEPLGNGKSIERVETYPTPNGSSIYTLTGREVDEESGAVIPIEKTLVDASAALALASAKDAGSSGFFTEVQPLDKWHSIMISAKINATPTAQTWNETQSISLPDTLEEIGVIWDSDGDEQNGFDSIGDVQAVKDNNLPWSVKAEAMAQASVMGRHYAKLKAGYSGNASVEVVRTYHLGPPPGSIVMHKFEPVYATLTIKGASGYMSGSGFKQGVGEIDTGYSRNFRGKRDLQMAIAQVGPFEHNGLSLIETGDSPTIFRSAWATSGSTPSAGIYPGVNVAVALTGIATLHLPTSSIPLTTGSTFIRHVAVKPWRLGYWVKEVYTATVP